MAREVNMKMFDPATKWPVTVKGNGCIEFRDKNHNSTTGYLHVYFLGRNELAHRAVWRFNYGDIPKGLVIRHNCDNRRCININHLSIGTQKQNIDDCVRRGRMPSGAAHYTARAITNITTGESFDTITQAAKANNILVSSIVVALIKKSKSNGCYWEYK